MSIVLRAGMITARLRRGLRDLPSSLGLISGATNACVACFVCRMQ